MPGDRILLMADVTRLAWVFRRSRAKFHPDMLLDAFLQRIGESGTLVVPAFNYDLKSGESFDRARTPTISGALGQAALEDPRARRTAHPLHSFAVAGSLQGVFLASSDPGSFGPRSPFALLREHSFKLLAIDLPLEPAFTYVHHVEEMAKVNYRTQHRFHVRYTDVDGSTTDRVFELYAKRPGYVNSFTALEPILRAKGVMHEVEIDGVREIQIDLAAAHAVIEEDIRENSARSIVHFKLKWWLRDLLKPLIQGMRPSRSALLLGKDAAGLHG